MDLRVETVWDEPLGVERNVVSEHPRRLRERQTHSTDELRVAEFPQKSSSFN